MSATQTSRTGRLAGYAAIAAALPAAAADAAVMTGNDLDLTATLTWSGGNPVISPVAIDFGAGFGELFTLNFFRSDWTHGHSTYSGPINAWIHSALVQFNPGNTGGWTAGSFVQSMGLYAGLAARLGGNTLLEPARTDWIRLTSTRQAALWTSFGDAEIGGLSHGPWAYRTRGNIGLRLTKDAGASHVYAWMDLSTGVDLCVITIHNWALETTPNTPIRTPTPGFAGLALLALGAAGVRRQRAIDA
jgi:hypothetical protein